MAYFSQAQKAAIAPAIKAICKKYGVSASLSVRDMSEVVLSIKSGVIDFIGVAVQRKYGRKISDFVNDEMSK